MVYGVLFQVLLDMCHYKFYGLEMSLLFFFFVLCDVMILSNLVLFSTEYLFSQNIVGSAQFGSYYIGQWVRGSWLGSGFREFKMEIIDSLLCSACRLGDVFGYGHVGYSCGQVPFQWVIVTSWNEKKYCGAMVIVIYSSNQLPRPMKPVAIFMAPIYHTPVL